MFNGNSDNKYSNDNNKSNNSIVNNNNNNNNCNDNNNSFKSNSNNNNNCNNNNNDINNNSIISKNNIKTQRSNKSCNSRVVLYNPPYCSRININLGKEFLRLVDKYFPDNHCYRKIFNRKLFKKFIVV